MSRSWPEVVRHVIVVWQKGSASSEMKTSFFESE